MMEHEMAMRKREDAVFPNAAAIDVGASSHWAAVPPHTTDAPVVTSRRNPASRSRHISATLGAFAGHLEAG